MTTPAYDDWARWYDLGEGDRRLHADFYASLAPADARRVLELGCGTGVLLASLRERLPGAREPGARFVGVDLSPRMLDQARSRDRAIEWIEGDLASPPVEGPFDYVFCAVATFQFLPTDARLREAFAAVRGLCAPGAVFAFDLFQPNLPYLRQPRRGTPTRRFVHDGRTLQILEDSHYEEDARMLHLDWRLVDAGDPAQALAHARFDIRQFFPDEVGRWLEAAGFEVERRLGSFHHGAFDGTSVRQAWVCRPRKADQAGSRQGGK